VVGTVLALEEPYRAVVLLRFDLKPGAIARRLGVPVETVRTPQARTQAAFRVVRRPTTLSESRRSHGRLVRGSEGGESSACRRNGSSRPRCSSPWEAR
jgi:hypothetical protein